MAHARHGSCQVRARMRTNEAVVLSQGPRLLLPKNSGTGHTAEGEQQRRSQRLPANADDDPWLGALRASSPRRFRPRNRQRTVTSQLSLQHISMLAYTQYADSDAPQTAVFPCSRRRRELARPSSSRGRCFVSTGAHDECTQASIV
ncbi:hypothetical protein Purlil1_12004 [Purpureocillium lilacinum]|uniref:Uncharacterized protein n=1 Tax=Purpureocillium lilacinum TaxID=33203 RepID=A0ABR0BIU2_PURLI|nr:hypothetical protein Purlil1_12004 [Purpureocillium lilacinum]